MHGGRSRLIPMDGWIVGAFWLSLNLRGKIEAKISEKLNAWITTYDVRASVLDTSEKELARQVPCTF